MAKFMCLCLLALIATVSAARDTSRDRDNNDDSIYGTRSFGFDREASRPSSPNTNTGRFGSRWSSADDVSENDFSTPKITAWKNGIIPYEISSDISAGNTAALKRMFQDISDKTCVKFQPKTRSDVNYVTIKSGNKCSAPLGMATGTTSSGRSSPTTGAVSNVILGQSCFTTKRVGRRLMNLLGIPHEVCRPDRDQFIEINMNNLRTGYANNIKQVERSSYLPGVLDVPYDIHSITQYNDDDLAKDENTWAIRLKGKRGTATSPDLGGETFSTADFQKIRKAYNCPASSSWGSSSSRTSTRRW